MEREEQQAADCVLQAYGVVSPRQFLALVSLWTGLSTATGVSPEPVDPDAWKLWMHRAKTAPGSSEGPPDRPAWRQRLQFRTISEVCRKDGRWFRASAGQMERWVDLIDQGADAEGALPDGAEARVVALKALGRLYLEEEMDETGWRTFLAGCRRVTKTVPTVREEEKA
jgi:hypothetical protein